MWQLWARLAFLDASTELCYNFYFTAVDSTCLCLTPSDSIYYTHIVLDKPEDGANLDCGDID